MAAWHELAVGGENKLADILASDAIITSYLPAEDLLALMDASQHIGDAPRRARELSATIRSILEDQESAPYS